MTGYRQHVLLALSIISVIGLAAAQNVSDQIDLSDDQLRTFVERLPDFLYRHGQTLDQGDYELLQDFRRTAAAIHERAYRRLKHESVALCERASSYDSVGLSDEIARIGREFHNRYAAGLRAAVSGLSEAGYNSVRRYIWTGNFKVTLTPWDLVQHIERDAQQKSGEHLKEFWCMVARERL